MVDESFGLVTLDTSEADEYDFKPEQAVELADALYNAAGHEQRSGSAYAGDLPLNEALLRVAAIHGTEVEFRYAKGDGAVIEHRRLVPQGLKRSAAGDLSFVGDDPDRDDIRAYRLDRIKGTVRVGD